MSSSVIVEDILLEVAQGKPLLRRDLETLCDMIAYQPALAKELYPCRGLSMKLSESATPGRHPSDRVFPLHLLLTAQGINKTLIKTVEDANPEAIKRPLQNGNLALHLAILRGVSPDIIEYLTVIYPEAVEHTNDAGQLPLHLMVLSSASGSINNETEDEVIRQLIAAHPDAIAARDRSGWTPLSQAMCCRCSFQVLRYLFAKYPKKSLKLTHGRGDLISISKSTSSEGENSQPGSVPSSGSCSDQQTLTSTSKKSVTAVKKITPAASTLMAIHMDTMESLECYLENWSRQGLLAFFHVMEGTSRCTLEELTFVYPTDYMHDSEVLAGFCNMISSLKQLRILEVMGTSIEKNKYHDFFLDHLADAILKRDQVETLDLNNFFIDDSTFFAKILSTSTTVASVSLERIALTERATKSLISGIEHSNEQLDDFSFQNSYPAPDRTTELVMALRSHATLTTLTLSLPTNPFDYTILKTAPKGKGKSSKGTSTRGADGSGASGGGGCSKHLSGARCWPRRFRMWSHKDVGEQRSEEGRWA